MKHTIVATAVALLQAASASCELYPPAFNITAISAKDNASRLECWQLDSEPVSARAAINFDLDSKFGDSFVGIIPPRTTSGTLSNAGTVQFSLVMAGLVHITTPSSGLADELNEAYIIGGRQGWLIAADTADIAADGHVTGFPSDENTIIAQFPVKNGKPPAHSVLHEGPCLMEDFAGL